MHDTPGARRSNSPRIQIAAAWRGLTLRAMRLTRALSCLLIATFPLLGAAPARAQAPAAAPAPATEKPLSKPNQLLRTALLNMSRLTSYHVAAELRAGAAKPTLEGDLGEGTLSLRGNDGRGNIRQRRVAGGKFYISNDDGKSWAEDTEKQATIMLSNLITGPVSPELKIWEKGEFVATEVTEGGENLLLVEKPATGKEPAAQFWLVKDEKLGAIFIRKASMVIAADDGEFPITVTYTKLNEPVSITAPSL